MTILVTGATGNVGGAVLDALHARGLPVRALSRGARDWPAGVEGVSGDLGEPSTLSGLADDVDGVFLLAGYDGNATLLEALPATARVALLSSSAAPSGDRTNVIARYNIDAEELVRGSGQPWTVVRPNAFMSNALRWKAQLDEGDVVRGPWGDIAVATIDPADLGEIIAIALTEDGHEGATYRVSGPQQLLPAEQLAILGAALGRDLTWESQTLGETRAELEAQMPTEYVDAFFAFYVDGLIDETTVQSDAERVLGRPPRTFADWARRHAGDFSSA
jgi:uncharacterized protein YbjT (DUF2867 family)